MKTSKKNNLKLKKINKIYICKYMKGKTRKQILKID